MPVLFDSNVCTLIFGGRTVVRLRQEISSSPPAALGNRRRPVFLERADRHGDALIVRAPAHDDNVGEHWIAKDADDDTALSGRAILDPGADGVSWFA